MNLTEYQELKDRVDTAQQRADRARGAYEQQLKQLKEEFGCATVKEARAKLLELGEREKELQAKLNSQLKRFEKKWSDALG